MASRRRDSGFENIFKLAAFRAGLAVRTVYALMPDASPRMKKKVANKLLTWTDGKDRSVRITEPIVREMVLRHSQCLQRNCPALLFTEPLTRELNAFFAEEGQ
jgi:hypothetical protein